MYLSLLEGQIQSDMSFLEGHINLGLLSLPTPAPPALVRGEVGSMPLNALY